MIFYGIFAACCLIPFIELRRYERMGYSTPGPFAVSLGVMALWIAMFPYYLLKIRRPIKEAIEYNGDKAPDLISETTAWFIYILGFLIVLYSFIGPYFEAGIRSSFEHSAKYETNSQFSDPEDQKPEISVRFVEKLETSYITDGAYWVQYIQNTGMEPLKINWALVNNREECFAVPIYNYDRTGISSLKVLGENPSNEVSDFVIVEVGQSIRLDMQGTNCGEVIRLKLGTSQGEYDVGPFS